MRNHQIKDIVFDLGGVLIDWDPRYLYKKIFDTGKEVEDFLENVCTFHWNEQQDAGRTLQEATEWLVEQHPAHEENIRAYYDRWEEMLGGVITGTEDILRGLHRKNGHGLFALTNWSAETFPRAQELYAFLELFQGIVVSGDEKLKKPDREIFDVLLERYGLNPETSVFIDDNINNIKTANEMGFNTVHFQGPEMLKEELERVGVSC